MFLPTDSIAERLADCVGLRPRTWQRVRRGYTPAERWVVGLEDGSSCFVKVGVNESTSTWLRNEYRYVYSRVEEAFLPRFLGWSDDPERPFIVLEDLSEAFWPPPWLADSADRVQATLQRMQDATFGGLPAYEDTIGDAVAFTWGMVELDPAPFLSLGLVDESWLAYALPILTLATRSLPLTGDSVIHRDIRSDNVCFLGGRTILIDWSGVCRGPRDKDLAFWAPSLEAEGGPPPEAMLPDAPDWAAFVAGYFAARAGLPLIPDAPRVREVQYQQLVPALRWAARALELPSV